MLSSPRSVTTSHDLAAALALGTKRILYSDIESEARHGGSNLLSVQRQERSGRSSVESHDRFFVFNNDLAARPIAMVFVRSETSRSSRSAKFSGSAGAMKPVSAS